MIHSSLFLYVFYTATNFLREFLVRENFHRFLPALEFFGTHDDGGCTTVSRDRYFFMGGLKLFNQLAQVVLYFRKGSTFMGSSRGG